uniref:Uncharacterized protein n=1 Tax=Mustela putorius furo TaxID=9669 RepID=M3YXV7_MUSPF
GNGPTLSWAGGAGPQPYLDSPHPAGEGGDLPPGPRLLPPAPARGTPLLALYQSLTAQNIAPGPDSPGPDPRSATHRLCDLRPVALPLPAPLPLYKMGIVAHHGNTVLCCVVCTKHGTQEAPLTHTVEIKPVSSTVIHVNWLIKASGRKWCSAAIKAKPWEDLEIL